MPSVLKISIPLILSTSAHTVQLFLDRVFCSWYAPEAMAAAMQAGIASFVAGSLFIGVAGYTNTFVAQYTGAKRDERVGAAVWQGIYFSLAAGVFMALISFAAGPIWRWVGHDPKVIAFEITYFRILSLGGLPMVLAAAVSCFYTGRGKTWLVFYVSVISSIVNIVVNYLLIFGNFGFPRMGIAGAAIGTVAGSVVACIIYIILFMQKRYRQQYKTLANWKFDRELFARLLKFGAPNGFQFMLDILAFTVFVALLGRMGAVAHSASTMVFNVNLLAFLPMIGMGIGVNILVGQFLGADNEKDAETSTWSAFIMCSTYMVSIGIAFVVFPGFFLAPFKAGMDPAYFAEIESLAVKLLWFVAFYCIFDTGNIIFAGALKGAGDTRFVMLVSLGLSWLIMVIPTYFVVILNKGIYAAWFIGTAYVCLLAVVFLLRFLQGKWKKMRVIESVHQPIPPHHQELPPFEAES